MKNFNFRYFSSLFLIIVSLLLIMVHISSSVINLWESELLYKVDERVEVVPADSLIISPDSLWKGTEFSR
jgi:hypothetical protein